jgi:O-antigen/teichoic acid export membrane protein
MLMIVFPEVILEILFGQKYLAASVALQYLSIGFFINSIFGPNGATLITFGKTRFLVIVTLIAGIINIALNYSLIPLLGITGAAIATTSTLVIRNILVSIRLYQYYRVHQFTRNYLKPAITAIIIIGVIYLVTNVITVPVTIWLMIVFFILFLIAFVITILFSRSIDIEDINMLLSVEKRLGLDLKFVKKLLRRFI